MTARRGLCYHRRMSRGTLALAVSIAMTGALVADAAADTPAPATFDAQARGATPVGYADLQGMVWAATATCDQADDVARRACRWVRDARLARLRGQTFLVAADKEALALGAWDPATEQVTVALRGCVACSFAIEAGGAKAFMASASSAPIAQVPRPFSGASVAERWRAEVLPRLRTQLLFRIPEVKTRATGDGLAQLLAIDVVGYRVVDPCSGAVIAASPESQRVAAEPAICGKGEVVANAVDKDRPRLPEQLSSADIRGALAPAEKIAQTCFDTYGVAGEARFRIAISDAGAVAAIEQEGDFAGTPTGQCIEAAVREASFPRTRRARTMITYPIVLR